MKGDLNNYGINNPDGSSNETLRIKIENESPKFIKENPITGQSDLYVPKEHIDTKKEESLSIDNQEQLNQEISQSSLSSSQAATTSLTSSISSLSGVIASTVATTVMAVAVFVSTLTINISLALATMHSLVLQVQMDGAQAEDFESPIWATLTGSDGITQEQEINQDTIYITFGDLNPATEYVIKVRNAEKVFTEKSFFTASEDIQMASIEASYEENTVYLSVHDVTLKSGEYYTITAKDSKGNVVYTKDSVDCEMEIEFTVDVLESLFFTLSVNGQIYACDAFEIVRIDPNKDPIYDLENVEWVWSEDYTSATLILTEIGGTRTLAFIATMTEHRTDPTCDEDESVIVVAQVDYMDKQFIDKKAYEVLGTHYEHSLVRSEEIPATCQTEGRIAHSYCERCGKYFIDESEVSEEELIIPVLNHSLHFREEVEATCEEDGFIACYVCDLCEEFFLDESGLSKISMEEAIIHHTGHRYGQLVPGVDATCEKEGYLSYYCCTICGRYFNENKDEIREEDLFVPQRDHALEEVIGIEPTCMTDGSMTHYQCANCGLIFNLEGEIITQEDIIVPKLDHDYGDYIEAVDATCDIEGHRGYYECSRCGRVFDDSKVEVDREYLIIPTIPHSLRLVPGVEPTCEHTGIRSYYECERCGKIFSDSLGIDELSREDLDIEMVEHEYQFKFIWEKSEEPGGYIAKPYLVCANNNSHIVELSIPVEISVVDDIYHASCEYEGQIYEDTFNAIQTVNLSLNNGNIMLYPDRYTLSGSGASTDSSNTIYHITGSRKASETLDVRNVNADNYTATKATFHIILDNATLRGNNWCTAFRIIAHADVDIYITVVGSLTVTAHNHVAIELQGTGNPHCNIYFTSESGWDNIQLTDSYNSGSVRQFGKNNGSMTVYMNGEYYNSY